MHIIFDLYGTLYQPGLSVMTVVKKISDALKLPYPDEAHVYGMLNKDMDDYLAALYPQVEDRTHLKHLFTQYEKQHATGGDIFPGMKEVLQQLKAQGHFLSICSTGPDAFIDTVLQDNKIEHLFDLSLSARVFLDKGEAIKTILKPNQSSVIIGDTIADFMAAIKNNIPSIGVNHGFGAADDFSAATFRAKNPAEIIKFVNNIQTFYDLTLKLTQKQETNALLAAGPSSKEKSNFLYDYLRYLKALGLSGEFVRLTETKQERVGFQLSVKTKPCSSVIVELSFDSMTKIKKHFEFEKNMIVQLADSGKIILLDIESYNESPNMKIKIDQGSYALFK